MNYRFPDNLLDVKNIKNSTMSQQKIPTSQNEKCLRCGKNKLITDTESGELFCGNCGLVITERVENFGPERTVSENSTINKSRTGDKSTLTRYDQGLSTMINPIDKDSAGNPLSPSMKSSLKRLRTWNNISSVKNNDERNLKIALSELLKMKEKLSLPDAVVEKAAYIYRKALEKKLVKGRSISALIASSLYAACRESGTPRTLKEVSDMIDVKRKHITVCYRMLLRELDLKMPVIDSVSCVAKIASNAEVSEKTKRHAAKILKKAKQKEMVAGKDPTGLAAAALYLASLKTEENVGQRTLAKASGITEVTIRNRCKHLKKIEV